MTSARRAITRTEHTSLKYASSETPLGCAGHPADCLPTYSVTLPYILLPALCLVLNSSYAYRTRSGMSSDDGSSLNGIIEKEYLVYNQRSDLAFE